MFKSDRKAAILNYDNKLILYDIYHISTVSFRLILLVLQII